MRPMSWSGLVLLLGMLLGCYPKGDPAKPIPHALVPAVQPAQRLVVVLPGRADALRGLERSGIAQAIQRQWPDADVVLAGLTLGYYFQRHAPERLHAEIVAPMRARGYREVWLVGASLGGMGALMYDREYPGEVDGMVLLAPYLGEPPLIDAIAAAGGLGQWDPGPVPPAIDDANFQHELWRYVQALSRDPARARRVWLVYGDRDRLRRALPLLAPWLPPSQVFERAGGHSWSVWTPATGEVLAAVEGQRVAQRAP